MFSSRIDQAFADWPSPTPNSRTIPRCVACYRAATRARVGNKLDRDVVRTQGMQEHAPLRRRDGVDRAEFRQYRRLHSIEPEQRRLPQNPLQAFWIESAGSASGIEVRRL